MEAKFNWEGFNLGFTVIRPRYRTILAENRTPVEKSTKKVPFFMVFRIIRGVYDKIWTRNFNRKLMWQGYVFMRSFVKFQLHQTGQLNRNIAKNG